MNWRILAIWLPLLLAGCEERDEIRMTTTVVEDGKTVKSKGPETVAVTIRRFPSDLFSKPSQKTQPIPSDFPLALYPGAEPLDVTKHHAIGQTEVLAEIEPIKDSPTVIADFYRKKLQTTGWTIKAPDKRTSDCVEIPAIRGKQSITVSIWDHEHDHDPDFSMIDNWKRRNTRATSIWINLYDLDDAQ